MRPKYAGDIFAQFNDRLRESRLAANRSQPIGAGAYGVVYQSDIPGNVMKQIRQDYVNPRTGLGVTHEASLQAVAAEMGIAPKVVGVETFTGGVGNRIEMADVRPNFEPVRKDASNLPSDPVTNIRVAQQLGALALKGIRLEDRHAGNIMQNKMTGRPLHLDFGIADRMSSDQQAAHLANVTADGFAAAGISEVGDILRATVMDYLEGGQIKEAMDVAKQGFSKLQKIKAPLTKNTMNSEDYQMEQMLKMMEAQAIERGLV